MIIYKLFTCYYQKGAIMLTNKREVFVVKQEKIERINELARKKKAIGLTDDELSEQKELYREYIGEFRTGLRGQLDNMIIERPDGTTIAVKNLRKK